MINIPGDCIEASKKDEYPTSDTLQRNGDNSNTNTNLFLPKPNTPAVGAIDRTPEHSNSLTTPHNVVHPASTRYNMRTPPINVDDKRSVLPETSARAHAQLPTPSKLKRDNPFQDNTPLKRPRSMTPIPYTSWSYSSPRTPNATTNVKLIHSSGTSLSSIPNHTASPSVTSEPETLDSRRLGQIQSPHSYHDLPSTSLTLPSKTPTSNVPRLPIPLSTSPPGTIRRRYPESIQNAIDAIPSSADWLSGALPSILQTDIGSKYDDLVSLLVRFESTHDFVTDRMSRLHTDGRPLEITKWVSNARGRRGTVIKIQNLSKFATKWWRWWKSLQPTWRNYDPEQKPITESSPRGTENWSCLIVPGANGFLSVIATLYWWGCAIALEDGEAMKDFKLDWDRAVCDCKWVLESLLEFGSCEGTGKLTRT